MPAPVTQGEIGASTLPAKSQTQNRNAVTVRKSIHRFGRAALVLGMAMLGLAHATTLRIASAFDPQTMDPHALALLYHSRVAYQIYDALLNRDEQYGLEPSLALSWQNTSPTSWRFGLDA